MLVITLAAVGLRLKLFAVVGVPHSHASPTGAPAYAAVWSYDQRQRAAAYLINKYQIHFNSNRCWSTPQPACLPAGLCRRLVL